MTPTQILMDEHQLILAVLDSLEEGADRLDGGDKVDPDFFLDAAEFVAGFADKCHHAKEEEILFVAMTAMDGPSAAIYSFRMSTNHCKACQTCSLFVTSRYTRLPLVVRQKASPWKPLRY